MSDRMRIACVLSRLYTYMISAPSSTARCTVSFTFSRSSRSNVRPSFDTFIRWRTSEPSRNSDRPRRYFPVSGFCSSMPSATSVTARRCTVLFATPRRLARSLMPISTCCSEKAFSSRIELATDESRLPSGLRGGRDGWMDDRDWGLGEAVVIDTICRLRCSAPWTGVPPDCRPSARIVGRSPLISCCMGPGLHGMARNIVVIGGGPAAVFAALEANKRDGAAEVTLVTEEACEPYEKPPLSKAVLLGKCNPEDAPIAGPGGLAKHGVPVKSGTRRTGMH